MCVGVYVGVCGWANGVYMSGCVCERVDFVCAGVYVGVCGWVNGVYVRGCVCGRVDLVCGCGCRWVGDWSVCEWVCV